MDETMKQWIIICSLDGKEPAEVLYNTFVAPETRTCFNEKTAVLLLDYLTLRARTMRWIAEPPKLPDRAGRRVIVAWSLLPAPP